MLGRGERRVGCRTEWGGVTGGGGGVERTVGSEGLMGKEWHRREGLRVVRG
jgi:hypothetical protein